MKHRASRPGNNPDTHSTPVYSLYLWARGPGLWGLNGTPIEGLLQSWQFQISLSREDTFTPQPQEGNPCRRLLTMLNSWYRQLPASHCDREGHGWLGNLCHLRLINTAFLNDHLENWKALSQRLIISEWCSSPNRWVIILNHAKDQNIIDVLLFCGNT